MPLGALVGFCGGLLVAGLGIAGILKTRGRRRRGRALAIIAIPLGVIGALLQGGAALAGHQYLLTSECAERAATVLATSSENLHSSAARFYGKYGSARFQASVTVEDWKAWLASALAERGQLQDLKRTAQFMEPAGSAVRFRFQGNFVNGTVPIEVEVGFDGDIPKVDDIRVGGSSPLR